MRNRRHNLISDIAFMALLILLFISIMFITTMSDSVSSNLTSSAALCIIFAIMIITHFTNITVGLIVNAIIIFGYASWLLYRLLVMGSPIGNESYFWIVMSPMLTVTTALTFRHTKQVDEENYLLKQQMNDYVTVDALTELKNTRAYESEMLIYRHLARRYNKTLILIVWEFRYEAEMKRLVGPNKFDDVAVAISKAMENVFRKEDVLYLLDNSPYRWGTLMLTDPDNERMLMKRLRDKIEGLDVKELIGKYSPKLEIRIGICADSDGIETPLQLLEGAAAQIQYDV